MSAEAKREAPPTAAATTEAGAATTGADAATADAAPVQSPALADRLARRVAPRILAAAANVTLPARLAAGVRRRAGGRGRVELFFAFDDPCSAVAVPDLLDRMAGRAVEVALLPVVRRGIPGDPAVASKRAYAVLDASRLARRRGRELARRRPLAATDTAFLAEWVAGAEQGPGLAAFCRAALERLWLSDDRPVPGLELEALWREHVGGEPRRDGAALRRCEARMARRGPYETPAVWVAGRWYFAQDRPLQICEWLDALGWRES